MQQKRFTLLVLIGCIGTMISLACNLPLLLQNTDEISPAQVEEITATETALEHTSPLGTPRIQTPVPTDAPNDAEPSPDDVPEIPNDIPPADAPAVPDCNAFDLNALNVIISGDFSFIKQDQLNNCHFESDNGYRLLIGGGKPTSVEEIKDLFDSSFGALPDATWQAIDDYYLGLAFSTISVTAQGVSASGHSMVIVAASDPSSMPADLQQILEDLGRESARQLNTQF